MAASTNTPAARQAKTTNGNNNNNGNGNGGGQENGNSGGADPATENSVIGPPSKPALRHNPGLSTDWTPDEQATLEDLLAKYASDSTIVRYAKISQALRDKTVRDVALRCRWMSKKENGKRRKDDVHSSKKNKDKKEKAADSLPRTPQVANRPNGPPFVQPLFPMDNDDGISFKDIGGLAGQLLEQNAQSLDQISANFSACKPHENIGLFCQTRTNILSIMNELNDAPEIMKQMPPIPVKLNEELVNTVLGRLLPLPKKA